MMTSVFDEHLADERSWNDGMTAFFTVHLVLTAVSLALGSIIGVLGIRGMRAVRGYARTRAVEEGSSRRATVSDPARHAEPAAGVAMVLRLRT